jgi:ribosome-associated toxin RatA of RatAB toxin-antitoxin module
MMRTVDVLEIQAPAAQVFSVAADVERWPERLPHYRYVRFLERTGDRGLVAMSAFRPFGPLGWPTWWTSEMEIDAARQEVRYRHVRGVTSGMDVVWLMEGHGNGTRVTLVHEWSGPPWGPLRRPAAEWVIGPVFVHGIASRTLAGLARHLERSGND